MKKIILLIAILIMNTNVVYAAYDIYAEKQACQKIEEIIPDNTSFMVFPKGNYRSDSVEIPNHCSSDPERTKDYDIVDIHHCDWKVGDYTDEGILLYHLNWGVAGGRIVSHVDGTRMFIYTDNTDYVTDECFQDDYIYIQTKNFKYTTTMGRNVVVKAYKKINHKYTDIILSTYKKK